MQGFNHFLDNKGAYEFIVSSRWIVVPFQGTEPQVASTYEIIKACESAPLNQINVSEEPWPNRTPKPLKIRGRDLPASPPLFCL